MTQPHLTVNEFEIIKEYLNANGSIESIPFTIKTWSIKLISEIERLRKLCMQTAEDHHAKDRAINSNYACSLCMELEKELGQ